jgi:hypothetical protein
MRPEILHMKNVTKKTKTTESQLLELLQQVLPKATPDPKLAGKIYEAVEQALQLKARETAFDKFCQKVALPNLETDTVQEARQQFATAFQEGDVTVKPNKKEKSMAVEVALPDGNRFYSEIKVRPVEELEDEDELEVKYVPFPVSLSGDPELIWLLAKRETMTPEEAGIALAKVEEEFWATKTGQKLLRDRVERSFPEFISRAPSGLLTEVGLKRHYKIPEPVKVLRPAPGTKHK